MKSSHFIFLGAALAIFGSFYSIWNSDFSESYSNVFALVGGITAGVAMFLYQRAVISNEEEYDDESILLLTNLKELMDRNAQLSSQLIQIKDRYGLNDSHCVIKPFIYPHGGLGFKAWKKGENEIVNLSLEIIDLEKLVNVEALGSSTIEEFRLASNVFRMESIPAQGVILPETGTSLYGEQRSFDITINTQQGKVIEYLRMYRIDQDWKTAIRIKNESTGHIIYETIAVEINKESLEW